MGLGYALAETDGRMILMGQRFPANPERVLRTINKSKEEFQC